MLTTFRRIKQGIWSVYFWRRFLVELSLGFRHSMFQRKTSICVYQAHGYIWLYQSHAFKGSIQITRCDLYLLHCFKLNIYVDAADSVGQVYQSQILYSGVRWMEIILLWPLFVHQIIGSLFAWIYVASWNKCLLCQGCIGGVFRCCSWSVICSLVWEERQYLEKGIVSTDFCKFLPVKMVDAKHVCVLFYFYLSGFVLGYYFSICWCKGVWN